MSNDAQQQPVFNIQKIYTKDISFENPNAPDVFLAPPENQGIEFNFSVQNKQVGEEHWEVALKISALAKNNDTDSVVFEIEVEHAAVFMIKHIPEEQMPVLLGVDCPSIIFPYTRQIISQLTVDGGFAPLLLDPFNFAAAFQASQQQENQSKPN